MDINEIIKKIEEWPERALGICRDILKGTGLTNPVIVDVGAHYAESYFQLNKTMDCKYYGFEPDKRSFEIINKLTDSDFFPKNPNFRVYQKVVGPSCCNIKFNITKAGEVCGVLSPEIELLQRVKSGDHEVLGKEIMEQITLDYFAQLNEIEKINLLKIDTEGYDLEVLKGAGSLLDRKNIDIIVSEVFFVAYRQHQSYFWDIAAYLKAKNYFFVNLYDTRNTSQGRMYTGNGVWVSSKVAQKLNYF